MRHIVNAKSALVLGSMGVVVMSALTGCESKQPQEQGNKFLVFQEDANGRYTLIEEHPTDGPTRAIVKDVNGNERFMSEAELKAMAQAEYEKMQSGNSELNQAPSESGGMGIGGAILAAAAGSLLGNMIANQLMGNKNFAQHKQAATSNVRSKMQKASTAQKSGAKKSFFGSNKPSTSKSKSFFGG